MVPFEFTSENSLLILTLCFAEYLSQFLNSQEDLDNTSVLSFTLSASEQLSALTKGIFGMISLMKMIIILKPKFLGINLLEKELQSQINNNYHDLISHGKWVENLENSLINMKEKVKVS